MHPIMDAQSPPVNTDSQWATWPATKRFARILGAAVARRIARFGALQSQTLTCQIC
jgi:hypothetical protein